MMLLMIIESIGDTWRKKCILIFVGISWVYWMRAIHSWVKVYWNIFEKKERAQNKKEYSS